jgi:hypothetical protein
MYSFESSHVIITWAFHCEGDSRALRHFVLRKLSNVMLWKSGRTLKTGIQCMAAVEVGCYSIVIRFSSMEKSGCER